MNHLARSLMVARGDAIAHQRLLNALSDVALLVMANFLAVCIDSDAANELFAILAYRDYRLPGEYGLLVRQVRAPGTDRFG